MGITFLPPFLVISGNKLKNYKYEKRRKERQSDKQNQDLLTQSSIVCESQTHVYKSSRPSFLITTVQGCISDEASLGAGGEGVVGF